MANGPLLTNYRLAKEAHALCERMDRLRDAAKDLIALLEPHEAQWAEAMGQEEAERFAFALADLRRAIDET